MALPAMRRRRWLTPRRTWALVTLASACLSVGLFLGLTCRPAWYRPPAVDYERLADDRRDFVSVLDAVGVALNQGRSIALTLRQEQVNRWLAARHDLSHEVIDLTLEGVSRPCVEFLADGSARFGATLRLGEWGAVLGVTLRARVRGDDAVQAEWGGLTLGRVSVPRGVLAWVAGRELARYPELRTLLESGRYEALNDFVWPNGRRRYRIESLEVRAGVLEIRLGPA